MTHGKIIQSIDGDGHTFIIIREVVLFNTPRRQKTASKQQQSAADNGCLSVVSLTLFERLSPSAARQFIHNEAKRKPKYDLRKITKS